MASVRARGTWPALPGDAERARVSLRSDRKRKDRETSSRRPATGSQRRDGWPSASGVWGATTCSRRTKAYSSWTSTRLPGSKGSNPLRTSAPLARSWSAGGRSRRVPAAAIGHAARTSGDARPRDRVASAVVERAPCSSSAFTTPCWPKRPTSSATRPPASPRSWTRDATSTFISRPLEPGGCGSATSS